MWSSSAKMRRNAITVLKYFVFAAFFLTLGPILIKVFFDDSNWTSDNKLLRKRHIPQGLPLDPDDDLPQVANGPLLWTQVPKRQHSLKQTPKGSIVPHFEKEEKIDWHNYTAIALELQRTGPGEQGTAVILSAEEEHKKDELYKVNGFNAFASDKIALDRAIKDIRHPDCKKQKYSAELLTVSVVIPFHNEHWSTLLRSVESVLNRSPKHLIHEILLVDDFSSKEHCKKPLDDYLSTHYGGKVKVVRQSKREGLIRTRISGAKVATGQVLIFLDSHIEANTNWLPPLLDPIAENYKTVVCPFIDVIDYENFAYRAQDEGARGAFDWEFFYKRLPLLPEDLKFPAKPFKSPVMAGGLFAISTKWFWEMGGYDPGLDIWGGEQYELSFKIWQCGGEMVDAPCSRVGHIYRKFAPFPNPGVGDFVGRNYRRVAEVWMDEYKEHLYKRRPHYRGLDPGDISEQKAIRDKLQCKPFKWFMEEVAFDLPKKYPPVEPPMTAHGELRNMEANLCVDTKFKGGNQRFGLDSCTKDNPGLGGEQQMELTWHRDLRPRNRALCFDVSDYSAKAPVILYECHGSLGNQWWKYNVENHQLLHVTSKLCLDCDTERRELFMMPCSETSKTQKWQWEHLNTTVALAEWKFDSKNA